MVRAQILTAVDLGEARELAKRLGVAERDEDDTVVSERANCIVDSRLLSTAGRASRNEDPSILAVEKALAPEATSGIPECLWTYRMKESADVENSADKRGRVHGMLWDAVREFVH